MTSAKGTEAIFAKNSVKSSVKNSAKKFVTASAVTVAQARTESGVVSTLKDDNVMIAWVAMIIALRISSEDAVTIGLGDAVAID